MYWCAAAIVVVCLTNTSGFSQEIPKVEQGVLDLRAWDFHENEPVKIEGDWLFWWNELLHLQDIHGEQNKVAQQTTKPFPNLWNGDSVDQHSMSHLGYATYYVKILLDEEAPPLAISIPDYYTANLLEVNHAIIAKTGTVGTTKDSHTPKFLNHTEILPSGSDTLEMVFQVSNFSHSKGGGLEYIRIGEKNLMFSLMKRDWALDLLLAGCFIMGGVFFSVLFLFGRHDRTIFFFSLFCFAYSYRILGTDFYTLHTLFPDIPWIITLRLEYLTLYFSALFFALYSYHLYRDETSRLFVLFSVIVCSIFGLTAVFLPSLIFTQLARPFTIYLLINFVYLFYTYIRAATKKREGSFISLFTTSVLFLTMGHTVFEYLGLLSESRLLYFLGFLQFFFFQSTILFYRHTRKLEAAKEKAEAASRSKSDFLSMISHEIRTPLNAVIGLTNFLISNKPRQNQMEELSTLKFSAENLHVLINDVLDYSKLDAGKIEFEERDVKIIELTQNIARGQETRAREKGISVAVNYDDQLPEVVRCDGLRLSQILTNLLGNAIKFTNEGSVTLSLTKVMQTKKRVSIKFLIQDTGIGIAKEKLDQIFESFSQASNSITREYGGTGLGLSITKKILDMQNIDIHVYSKVGEGSRFYFTQTFPISESPVLQIKDGTKTEGLLLGKKVLLVEDNVVNVMVASKFLSRWNIDVSVAENGLEALEMVDSDSFDLILMDIQMPVMDGYKASKQLRQRGVAIPIIALTASVLLEVGDKVREAGMDDYVSKPFDPDELYNKILFHIEKSVVQ